MDFTAVLLLTVLIGPLVWLVLNMIIWGILNHYETRLEMLRKDVGDPILNNSPNQERIDTLEQRVEWLRKAESFLLFGLLEV